MTRTAVHRAACVLFVILTSAAYLVAAAPPGTRGAGYIALHLGLLLAMGVCTATMDAADVRWVIASGILARLVLMAVPAFTSNDIHRYLWDGHLVALGVDPWAHAPTDLAATTTWSLPPDNAGYRAIYPPGAMALFAAAAAAGADLATLVWKLLTSAASIGTLLLVSKALGPERRRWLPLLALHPLAVLESGVGAHVDVFAGLAVALWLVAEHRGRPGLAGAAAGLGAIVKLAPLVLLVAMVPARGRFRSLVLATATACGIVLLAYAPPLLAGWRPVGSLPEFIDRWRFAAPLFGTVESLEGTAIARFVAAAAAALLMGAALWMARMEARAAGAICALLAVLIASPAVFPWYLVSAITLLPAFPSATLVAWSAVAPLSYEVLDQYEVSGVWEPHPGIPPLILAALVGGVVADVLLHRRRAAAIVTINRSLSKDA